MKISFHGGAREVTGACYLLETDKTKLLIDCGLFQGTDECEELNFKPFNFKPESVDAVLITHAHLDHIGRVPKLIREGFRGKVFSTAPTKDLAVLMLDDALGISERQRKSLYDRSDLEEILKRWEVVSYQEEFSLNGEKIRFYAAGHILGSAMVEIKSGGKRFLFSGDLGNVPSVLLPPPEIFHDIEYLVIESTYGNRAHEAVQERILNLERAVEDAAARGGTLMIPAFATERTQDILHLLNEMLLFKRIPEIPVYVDAPLAIRVTKVFEQYTEFYREEIRELFGRHPNLFKFKKLRLTESVEESKSINAVSPPKVILAGSGMMAAGRILHHAKRYLPDPKSILLIMGYQAAGSLGRRLVDGEKSVKIMGEEVAVRAEVRQISGFSAHADNPQLFKFVEANRDSLKRVFVVQGEEAQALHFSQEIRDRLGVSAETPELYQEFEL